MNLAHNDGADGQKLRHRYHLTKKSAKISRNILFFCLFNLSLRLSKKKQ